MTTPSTRKVFVTESTPSETPVHRGPTTPEPNNSPVKGKGKGKAKPKAISTPSVQSEPGTPISVASKGKRVSKKAIEQAAQMHREEYAKEFFQLLNNEIFQSGLPEGTQLQWNNRLQTTAGKAHWERTKDGKETSIIQLSPKILDSDERIRNTLSHEMCHLACWVINRNIKENHGNLWKGWAQKVMRRRPDVEITTKHTYEIAYKFTWKCSKCDKIYGRHSKSIDPALCLCGVCKEGELVPQFAERVRNTPKDKAGSRMASDTPRGACTCMCMGRKAHCRVVFKIPHLLSDASVAQFYRQRRLLASGRLPTWILIRKRSRSFPLRTARRHHRKTETSLELCSSCP
ncbi:hypothetical protein SCHPADRAFT_948665 [Schizopora paradoxa]|uniref:SprT-like domain-containing protein n=1 Tax=Schizopora paradoxa TaxID=27342 RepID=A0A0H2STH3_9AGAM|nr:hypothetical protein SCHPADRAFT_948665 [Schizopora paradoxa]